MTGCLVYFVPDAGTLTKMSYRPLQAFPAITWEGAILPPVTRKPATRKPETRNQDRNRNKNRNDKRRANP
jgi:hypothetical protein